MSDLFKVQTVVVEVQIPPFAMHLKSLRTRTGKTQQQVADEIGAKRTAYTAWEQGTSFPKIKCVVSLCKALNVSPNDLFLWEPADHD